MTCNGQISDSKDIKKNFKTQMFFDISRNEFLWATVLISFLFTDIKKSFFDIKVFFYIYIREKKFDILLSNNIGYQEIIFWYQEFKLISWYHKTYFQISDVDVSLRHRFNIFEVFSDIRKWFFFISKIRFFHFLISRIRICDIKKIKKIDFLISKIIIFDIKKITCFSDIKNFIFLYQKIIYWYQKFEFLISENEFLISEMICIFWYQKIDFLISENKTHIILRLT